LLWRQDCIDVDFVFDRLQWFIAIGGLGVIVLAVRQVWHGIWHLVTAEIRALNCEAREAALEEHAATLLRRLKESLDLSGD
jgi:hypothetical protein